MTTFYHFPVKMFLFPFITYTSGCKGRCWGLIIRRSQRTRHTECALRQDARQEGALQGGGGQEGGEAGQPLHRHCCP